MKNRSLEISGDLWIDILKNGHEQHFRVIKNALPEDAKCVGIDWSNSGGISSGPVTVSLMISSAVFQDSDPDELPLPVLQSLYPAKGEYKPYGEV